MENSQSLMGALHDLDIVNCRGWLEFLLLLLEYTKEKVREASSM
jgi:hypothetical protein